MLSPKAWLLNIFSILSPKRLINCQLKLYYNCESYPQQHDCFKKSLFLFSFVVLSRNLVLSSWKCTLVLIRIIEIIINLMSLIGQLWYSSLESCQYFSHINTLQSWGLRIHILITYIDPVIDLLEKFNRNFGVIFVLVALIPRQIYYRSGSREFCVVILIYYIK